MNMHPHHNNLKTQYQKLGCQLIKLATYWKRFYSQNFSDNSMCCPFITW